MLIKVPRTDIPFEAQMCMISCIVNMKSVQGNTMLVLRIVLVMIFLGFTYICLGLYICIIYSLR